jgi:hypothetical protein
MNVRLPLRARAASWKIKSVEFSHLSTVALDIRYCEILFPQLMQGNHVMYSRNSQTNTRTPDRALRFYVNRYNNDQNGALASSDPPSNLRSCVSTPDLDLGYHILDSLELSMEFVLRGTDIFATLQTPENFTIILEYNQ